MLNGYELKPPTEKAIREKDLINLIRITYADQKTPVFKEDKSRGIKSYGEKNDYPEKLLDLYNRSGKHGAIITKKVRFIVGKETTINGSTEHPRVKKWNKHDNIQQFKTKILNDKKLSGNMAIEVVYDRAGKPEYFHINWANVRTLDHKSYQYWPDGSKTKKQDVIHYDAYDPNNLIIDPSTGLYKKQILYIREYRAGMGVYALPDYISGQQYIEIDTRISNYHLNEISNGFTGGTLVEFFKGEPPPEELRKLKRKFKSEYQGDDAKETGGVILSFNEQNEQGAKITPMNGNDLDKRFLALNDHVTQEIFVAHGVTSPMLFGVRVEGQLGGRNELAEAYEIYYRDVIEAEQEEIDALLEEMLDAMGEAGEVQTKKMEPIGQDWVALFQAGLADKPTTQENIGIPIDEVPQRSQVQILSDSINSLSPLVANKVLNELTVNEVRSLAGLPPLPGGDAKSNQNVQFNVQNGELSERMENDLKIFAMFGEDASNYEPLTFKFGKLTENEIKVMSAINSDEQADPQAIANATKIALPEVEKILKSLDNKNKIKWSESEIRITDAGRNDINDQGGFDKIEIKWKYALDPDAPPLRPGGKSRPFCVKMIELNRVYTRDDIDKLSQVLGYDVWTLRGGWYHDPEKDVNLPHCRHQWMQTVVRRKNG